MVPKSDRKYIHNMAKVKISTPLGDIVVRLYDETPLHRDNFLKLAKEGFYDGTIFHRVIRNFMIQGGDPDSKGAPAGMPLGRGDVGYTIPAEFKKELRHKRGALAAARLGDFVNPKRNSSGCQFYIVWGRDESGTPFLDGQYTVFGEVEEGLEIVGMIQESQTDAYDRPLDDIPMKMTVL